MHDERVCLHVRACIDRKRCVYTYIILGKETGIEAVEAARPACSFGNFASTVM